MERLLLLLFMGVLFFSCSDSSILSSTYKCNFLGADNKQ